MRFYYHAQDYLGNNSAVINGSTGAIEQTVAYYPYGGVIADLGTKPTSGQPYKFGGKELITANGLNEYDFGARRYLQAVPHFTSIDPLCEKRPDLSTYLYCGNNPVNAIDPTGKDSWSLDASGNIIDYFRNENFDEIRVFDKKTDNVNIWKGDYGTIQQSSITSDSGTEYSIFATKNDEIGTSVFEFLAQNTSVEWSQLKTGFDENSNNFITTSHLPNKEQSAAEFIKMSLSGTNIRADIHSHPSGSNFPSGMDSGPDWYGDIAYARWLEKFAPNVPMFMIFTPSNKQYIIYNSKSTKFEFSSFFEQLPDFNVTVNKKR